jgi:hypothetical protein
MTCQIDKFRRWRRLHLWTAAALVLPPIFLGAPYAAASAPRLADVQHFRFEQQAQQHCPNDSIVWAIARSGVYHSNTDRWYGQTTDGTYVCRKDAEAAGYHPSRASQ